MKRTFPALFVVLVISLTGCSSEPSTISAADALPPSADALPPANAAPPVVADKPKPKPVTVPAGTKLRVVLIDAVSSDKSRAGDSFLASLSEPVVVNGKTVLPKGTKVRGRVVEANESGRVKGRASLQLKLTQVVFDKGKSISIKTKTYTAVAEPTKKRDAALIGGGAGLGAAIGAITGGGKGAAIGAAVGGGAGTGTVLATKGKEIRYDAEHPLSFSLSDPMEI